MICDDLCFFLVRSTPRSLAWSHALPFFALVRQVGGCGHYGAEVSREDGSNGGAAEVETPNTQGSWRPPQKNHRVDRVERVDRVV